MTLVGQHSFDGRADVVRMVPGSARRILDVGCGPGLLGAELMRRGAVEVWGIERDPRLADVAASRLSRVIRADLDIGPGDSLERGYFDCLIYADVLEHLVDPWATLRNHRPLLGPDGVVVISMPNVRNLRVIMPLLLRGRWDYAAEGILSVGHLRFFTTLTMRDMIERAGYRIEAEAANYAPRGRMIKRLSFGLLDDLVAQQRLFRASGAGGKPSSRRQAVAPIGGVHGQHETQGW